MLNRKQLLTNNVSEIVGEYLNGMMDYPDDYAPMTVRECVEYVRSQLFDIYSWGNGSTDYAPGIARELNFLGSRTIDEEIYRVSKNEGILKDF